MLIAAEEALRRLEVDNLERNAILEAFRYVEQRRAHEDLSHELLADAQEQATSSSEPIDSRPLTRCASFRSSRELASDSCFCAGRARVTDDLSMPDISQ